MKTILLSLLIVLCCSSAYAERLYESTLVICKLKLNNDGDALVLDLPFRVYGQNIVMQGKDITYRLNDLSNEGKEVLAKVDFRIKDKPNSDIKSEREVVEKYKDNLGRDWEQLKKSNVYKKHFSVTKEDALATYDKDGNKIPYTGADKAEVVKFAQWEEEQKEIVGEPVDGGVIDVGTIIR
jgi:hypothetical protein